ncbi:hypothetical protein [Mycoplasmopsis canis]|uniref:hypothetical protein n=1 Tax=Mycoplasmopsis canis TaxID=29555 RepID=UPI000A59FEB6|nr:hypothetical protein [Mycoplasmopsis canis]WQQ12488.1 hypothetical protein RRG48_00360 [Mycoplasmopsis canis]
MKKKQLLIQILEIKNILNIFSEIDYPSISCNVEQYCENLFDTVSTWIFLKKLERRF